MQLEDFLNVSGLKDDKTDAEEDTEDRQLCDIEKQVSHIFFPFFLFSSFLL